MNSSSVDAVTAFFTSLVAFHTLYGLAVELMTYSEQIVLTILND